MMSRRFAFTLVELVIVVLVVGILASVVAPKMMRASRNASETELRQTLAVVRNAIDRFSADNNGVWPAQNGQQVTFKVQLAPYLPRFPANPVDKDGVLADAVKIHQEGGSLSGQASGTQGWAYDNKTGEFIANSNELSTDGVTTYAEF